MSGNNQNRRNLPTEQSARTAARQIGNQVFTPALPLNPADAMEVARVLGAHWVAVAAMDNISAAAVAFQARRNVIYDEAADVEAQHEAERELRHQRQLAEKRRERQLLQDDLETLQVRDKIAAVEEFRDHKFGLGAARFAEKMAKHRVGEATARAAMQEELLEPEPKPTEKSKSTSTAETLAFLADDLEKQIEEAEAAGRPTDQLRGELKSINALLRRELLKSAGR
jgi:hypothetical protein